MPLKLRLEVLLPFPQSKGTSMTPSRQRMIRELELQRKSKHTIRSYVATVAQLARHYGRPPEKISRDEVRDFVHHLIVDRKLASASIDTKFGRHSVLLPTCIGATQVRFED